MGITKKEAQQILGVSEDASSEAIRSQYKKLAKENHPDKHGGSSEATKKFQDISVAYKKLTNDDSSDDEDFDAHQSEMSFEDMMDLFARVMLSGHQFGLFDESSEDDFFYPRGGVMGSHVFSSKASGSNSSYSTSNYLTKEEREQNARDLISEEEREKKRAAKRRDKKKRRREKKRQEKSQSNPNPVPVNKPSSSESSSESEVENVHPQFLEDRGTISKNAYATKNKKFPNGISDNGNINKDTLIPNGVSQDQKPRYTTASINQERVLRHGHENQPKVNNHIPPEQSNSIYAKPATSEGKAESIRVQASLPTSLASSVTRPFKVSQESKAEAMKLATRGNQFAAASDFVRAVDYFTQALEKNPNDHRFFGNRSFCFDKLADFHSALGDAEHALKLKPDWAKGYYRKGRALAGIQSILPRGEKDYSEAEHAFLQVLKLDPQCEDALVELGEVRVQAIVDMGFTEKEARESILEHGTKELALDSLLQRTAPDNEIYESDDDDFDPVGFIHASPQPKNRAFAEKRVPKIVVKEAANPVEKGADYDRKTDPTNPDGLKSIWVGNVDPATTEKGLKQLFSRAGVVTGIKVVPEKLYAFVNFDSCQAAAKAMEKFQNHPFNGQFLFIKFPNNPTKGFLTKPVPEGLEASAPPSAKSMALLNNQAIKEGECYYWRTSGCKFGSTCKFKHVKAHKGIDWRNKEF